MLSVKKKLQCKPFKYFLEHVAPVKQFYAMYFSVLIKSLLGYVGKVNECVELSFVIQYSRRIVIHRLNRLPLLLVG